MQPKHHQMQISIEDYNNYTFKWQEINDDDDKMEESIKEGSQIIKCSSNLVSTLLKTMKETTITPART